MKKPKGFFGHMFRGTGKGGAPGARKDRGSAGKPSPGAEQLPGIPYKKGDFIGKKSAWSNKGGSLFSLGRYDEAIHCYDRILKLDPLDAKAWNNKGNCLGGLGRFDEAIRCYDRALEIDPQYPMAWNNKALTETILGRRRDAAHSYQQFLAVAPTQYAEQIEHVRQLLQELGKS